jgi:hypothetical protein
MAEAFAALRASGLGRWLPPELADAIPALLKAIEAPDSAVRIHLLAALRVAAPRRCPECSSVVLAVARSTLSDVDPTVVVAALNVIKAAGVDAASVATAPVTKLLTHPNPRVRVCTCKTLAWLGPDARAAVPTLLDVAVQHVDASLRNQATLALTGIDVDGALIDHVLADPVQREQLLAALRDLGSAGRVLRRSLQARWQVPGSGWKPLSPPGFERVWHELTATQRELLTAMWDNRRKEGLPVADLYPLMAWETSNAADKCLRVHLAGITRRLRSTGMPIPWIRRDKRIFWQALAR